MSSPSSSSSSAEPVSTLLPPPLHKIILKQCQDYKNQCQLEDGNTNLEQLMRVWNELNKCKSSINQVLESIQPLKNKLQARSNRRVQKEIDSAEQNDTELLIDRPLALFLECKHCQLKRFDRTSTEHLDGFFKHHIFDQFKFYVNACPIHFTHIDEDDCKLFYIKLLDFNRVFANTDKGYSVSINSFYLETLKESDDGAQIPNIDFPLLITLRHNQGNYISDKLLSEWFVNQFDKVNFREEFNLRKVLGKSNNQIHDNQWLKQQKQNNFQIDVQVLSAGFKALKKMKRDKQIEMIQILNELKNNLVDSTTYQVLQNSDMDTDNNQEQDPIDVAVNVLQPKRI